MKKIAVACMFALAASVALADSYTYSVTLTNTQPITYSDALPISGYFERAEVTTEAASTQTVTLATYSGTTAAETFFSKAISAGAGVTVFRTRTIGSTYAGVDLAAVQSTSEVSTVLSAAYEKPLLGGNVKVAATGTANDGSAPVTVVIYYTPSDK